MEDAITYQELKLSLCDILYVESLTITEEVNCHAVMNITVLLKGKMKAEVIHEMGETVTLFSWKAEGAAALFQGKITDLRLLSEGGAYRLKVEAKSFTYDMDIQRKRAAYQDTGMTSHAVLESIMSAYPGNDYQACLEKEAIGELMVQYEETDWEFLKRFASKYNQGIYVDNSFPGIRFYAGIPDCRKEVEWERKPYTIYKDMEQYRRLKANAFPGIRDTDFITWRIEAYEYVSLGTGICFQGQKTVIFRADRQLKNGLLVNQYHMRRQGGLKQMRYYNDRINGVSVDGNVIAVKRDKVQAKLKLDTGDRSNTYWFPFSTVAASKGGNGWYCMPKAGDTIRAYFPEARENQGYLVTKIGAHIPEGGGGASSSAGAAKAPAAPVSQPAPSSGGGAGEGKPPVDPMGDPNVKNIITPSGKEISFSETGVVIQADGGISQILLNMDGSVTVSGMVSLSFHAAEEIHLRAEDEISISADMLMDASCEKDGHVAVLPGGIMQMNAKEIYEN